jgi:deoxyribodipyrimidine photolyase-related protein
LFYTFNKIHTPYELPPAQNLAHKTFSRIDRYFIFTHKFNSLAYYDGNTGIEPVDVTIKKLLKTGYNHHIERLMILGNFMLLCEIDPNEIYNWFMEMYIDAYDWVMVPNVYGMSQFADGGLMSTKPYISSSNYVRKMSDFKSGEWTKIWDSLFWNFIYEHKDYFASNNRTVFISKNLDKMSTEKLNSHLKTAKDFLETLN